MNSEKQRAFDKCMKVIKRLLIEEKQCKQKLERIQKENINYAQKINSSFNDRNRKVGQYDKNNNLINTFESISEASRQTGINIASISYSANGKRKTGGGFVWHFV